MSWFLKYVGCAPNEIGCMGPSHGWWLFGVPLNNYPFMILIALVASPPIYLTLHNIKMILRKEKRQKGWVIIKNIKWVFLTFLIIMLIEIVLFNIFMANVVY